MRNQLLLVEAGLAALAYERNDKRNVYDFVVAMLDKYRLNAINSIGGSSAGDMTMAAHLKVAENVAEFLARTIGAEYAGLIRPNLFSDEAVLITAGRNLEMDTELVLNAAWMEARENVNLRDYKYDLTVPGRGDAEVFHLDLEAFSEVLRHPEMVRACEYSMSKPRHVRLDLPGFIAEEIRELEDRKVAFFKDLPDKFKTAGSRPEATTPFEANLATAGITRKNSGSCIEIKLGVDEADARKLLEFTRNHDGIKGTRKGFAEVFSRRIGMRGLNTFLGNTHANSILTAIALAMEEVAKSTDVRPLDGGYLQYWVGLPSDNNTRKLIEDAVARRIPRAFKPLVTMLEASGMELTEAKERFILKALGKDTAHPAGILERTDFMLNVLENIDKEVLGGIYEKMKTRENGSTPIVESDLEHIKHVEEICLHRRTIRDTEDFIWTLRMDEMLPEQIKARKAELEAWLFEFSWARFESVSRFLAESIRERIRQRRD
jgi:hypothetical protein